MIHHWRNLIIMLIQSKFWLSFDIFASKCGPKFQHNMHSTWVPIAENIQKLGIHWLLILTTGQIPQLNQLIPSSNLVILAQHSLTSIIKLIKNDLGDQSHKISAQYNKIKINTLMYICQIFSMFHRRITHFSLRKAKKKIIASTQLEKNSPWNGCHCIHTWIPCEFQH